MKFIDYFILASIIWTETSAFAGKKTYGDRFIPIRTETEIAYSKLHSNPTLPKTPAHKEYQNALKEALFSEENDRILQYREKENRSTNIIKNLSKVHAETQIKSTPELNLVAGAVSDLEVQEEDLRWNTFSRFEDSFALAVGELALFQIKWNLPADITRNDIQINAAFYPTLVKVISDRTLLVGGCIFLRGFTPISCSYHFLRDGKKVISHRSHSAIPTSAAATRGGKVYVGFDSGNVLEIALTKNAVADTLEDQDLRDFSLNSAILNLAISSDEQLLAVGAEKESYVYRLSDLSQQMQLSTAQDSKVKALAWHPTSSKLLAYARGNDEQTLRLVNTYSGETLAEKTMSTYMRSLVWTEDGRELITNLTQGAKLPVLFQFKQNSSGFSLEELGGTTSQNLIKKPTFLHIETLYSLKLERQFIFAVDKTGFFKIFSYFKKHKEKKKSAFTTLELR